MKRSKTSFRQSSSLLLNHSIQIQPLNAATNPPELCSLFHQATREAEEEETGAFTFPGLFDGPRLGQAARLVRESPRDRPIPGWTAQYHDQARETQKPKNEALLAQVSRTADSRGWLGT
ncbi:hypothetical protein CCMA1212_007407 [Trichoderma ghanense]|uniref:Uncharacterized protein n=1 Tax=Trichoderma ghanense TaxID=65468 RepID=A0ABY2GY63_9HYPO